MSLDPAAARADSDIHSRNLWVHWGGRFVAVRDRADALDRYLNADTTWFARRHGTGSSLRVAYFSAEFAVSPELPIYAGGLGVLAGDHLKSASDLGVPLVAVGLLYREGYFSQKLGLDGDQRDEYGRYDPDRMPLARERRPDGEPLTVEFPFRDRRVYAAVWRADVGRVPLYLLDTDVPANTSEDRRITDRLYGGDVEHRLKQEIVLGIGGMRALAALDLLPTVLHLNEGHAAFAAVERVRQVIGHRHGVFRHAADRLADSVLFTTHTPVPAGHDAFPPDMLEHYLGGYVWEMGEPWDRFLALGRLNPHDRHQPFNMTVLALRLSQWANGVSRLHGAVSRHMWHGIWPERPEESVPIGHVTNGVHVATWVAEPTARVYEKYVGEGWTEESDPFHWHRAAHIPLGELWRARNQQRARMVELARERLTRQIERNGGDARWASSALSPDALTIVFARRFATYKRAALLLHDEERLVRLLERRNVQFVFAGKAHPRDIPGQDLIRRIYRFAARPEVRERFVVLEGYDLDLAASLTAGADVWLNVPRRPREASGTSGMKAAASGALNLSIPDGWWAEAWAEHNRLPHPIGWSIEDRSGPDEDLEISDSGGPGSRAQADQAAEDARDAAILYDLLERDVVPLFTERDGNGVPTGWCERVRSSIRQVVPFFSTHRMVSDYVERYYLPANGKGAARLAALPAELDDVG